MSVRQPLTATTRKQVPFKAWTQADRYTDRIADATNDAIPRLGHGNYRHRESGLEPYFDALRPTGSTAEWPLRTRRTSPVLRACVTSRRHRQRAPRSPQLQRRNCLFRTSRTRKALNVKHRWKSTRSHPEMVGDMSRVTLNCDLSKIPFVRFYTHTKN